MTGGSEDQILWFRAQESLRAAEALVSLAPDSAASRAYYAAFHAVSALFRLEGRHFSKHQDVRASVHRDLVNAGRWDRSLGKDFDQLRAQRDVGDYGSTKLVTEAEAADCVEVAARVLEAVRAEKPDVFGPPPES